MTTARYGILTALRAKGRTRLFALLILILTIALVLGVGIWTYCEQLITRFNETYTSIILAEYMGEDYPDENAADELARAAAAALDDEAVSSVEGVMLWERPDIAMAYLEGYKRVGGNIPYNDYGVIVVSNPVALENGKYTGRIRNILYTREGKEGIFSIFDPGQSDLVFEIGTRKSYLLHGKFVSSNTSNHLFVVTDFYEGCETKPWLELSGDDDPALKDSLFTKTADFYRMANNSVKIFSSDDIAALEVFQQSTLYLEDGRFPMAGEPGVCLLSGSAAENMGIGVGDKINVSMLTSNTKDRYDLTETDDKRVLEVVGITNSHKDHPGNIWVSKAEGNFSGDLYGYELGRAVVDNDLAVQAVSEMEKLMPDQVRLTLYDQGYSSAVKPIRDLRSTAVVLTLATLCAALAVLFLFAYLFVGRQRESVKIMVSLGTPKRKIRQWLLSGAGLVALTSSVIGTAVGYLSLNGVTALALLLAQKVFSTDTLYSNAALGIVRETPSITGISIWYALAVGAAVFLTALILCLAFLRQAKREDTLKKGKTTVRLPKGKTSVFGKGAMRFALLSAKRGGYRSAVVPAAVLVLTMLIGLMAIGASGWNDQLDELYENSSIEGQVVTLNGRSASNLVLSIPNAKKLWKSGMLSDVSVSLSWKYWTGETPAFVNSLYGIETRDGWISNQAALTAANSLSSIPEFYYTDRPEIQWLEGWDESFLADTETPSILRSLIFINLPYTRYGNEPYPTYPLLADNNLLRGYDLSPKEERPPVVDNWEENDRQNEDEWNNDDWTDDDWNNDGWTDDGNDGWTDDDWNNDDWNNDEWIDDDQTEDNDQWIYDDGLPEEWNTDSITVPFLAGSEDYSALIDLELAGINDRYSSLPANAYLGGEPIPTYPALVSRSFLEENGLRLGDETEIMIWLTLDMGPGYPASIITDPTVRKGTLTVPIKIVGSFQQTGQKSNIYVPLSFWCNSDQVTGDSDLFEDGEYINHVFPTAQQRDKYYYSLTNFKTCRFTLTSAYELEPFKNFLVENSYSQVGKINRNRITILMTDQEFTETLSGLKRYITFGSILFPVLFLAVAAIGFIISWLMINGRRMEFAILRGLGASRRRVFATFFAEQGMLCILGCLIGALILMVFKPLLVIWLTTAIFIICYLVGCALSIRAVGRINLMELLSERE
ncbi:MAG: hypothetical protein J1E05_06510 [Eubacterium sp.]|nr:hypothetical protein [Eubacterium sp.]